MSRILLKAGMAMLIASACAAPALSVEQRGVPLADGVVQQRIDTEEVTIPPPPTGPSTPVPFCSPSSPICP